jgi:hypothetical protein
MCQSLVEKRNQDLETPEGNNSVLYWAGTALCYTITPEEQIVSNIKQVHYIVFFF